MYPSSRRSISAIFRPLSSAPPSSFPRFSTASTSSHSSLLRGDPSDKAHQPGQTVPSTDRSLSSLPESNIFSARSRPSLFGHPPSLVPSYVSSSASLNGIPRLNFSAVRGEATAAENEVPEAASDKEVPKEVPEAASTEKFEYQAEVSRLLDLIVHSLYSHKEVFLRELVSNASDALDKLRFLSVTDPGLLGNVPNLDIKIKTDQEKGTLTLTDTGIGMTKDELIKSLGTIAQSGTANFLKALKESKEGAGGDNNLIGKFGVGFYSSFLVADKVSVSTKSSKSDKQYVWEAEANCSSFVVREETDPENLLPRGTSITLHLKEDDKLEYTDPVRIQNLVKNYSQFISFPIYIWQEKTREVESKEDAVSPDSKAAEEEDVTKKEKKKTITEKYFTWEIVNESKPIWLRSPKEVSEAEYGAFYKKTFNEYREPMAYTHFTTEGEIEFKSLLYIPGMAPFTVEDTVSMRKNIKLYVKRVFISDEFDGELLPRYLGFVKGVIDSNDLPLNVSREVLQESRIVNLMKKRLVKKTFDLFDSIAKRDNKEDYKKFWINFGKYIKLGCVEDTPNRKRLSSLLRFYSSKHEDEVISLKTYLDNMKKDQKSIYYLAADTIKSAKSAPFLEELSKRDIEVLFLVEPMDEVAVGNLQSFEGKKFLDISKEDFDLGGRDETKDKELKKEYSFLCDWMKQKLGERIAKVEISKRLSSSPCVLVSGKYGLSANMERIMKSQTLGDTSTMREYMRGTRVLEINPSHPIIQDLDEARKDGKANAIDLVELLYETALMSSGFTPEDPAAFGARIYDMMASSVGKQRFSTAEGVNGEPAVASRSAAKPIVTSDAATESVREAEVLETDAKSQSESQ